MTHAQRAFIDAELFQLTLAAVTQRGAVYRRELPEAARRPVHATLRERLEALLPQYAASEIPDALHLANLTALAQAVTSRHADVLRDGRFRIGSAQKALNLCLKYRWCLGEIPRPPHCPFDFYVLRRITGWESRRWTAIDSIEEYARLVAAARDVAGDQSLAEWELTVYNDEVSAGASRHQRSWVGDGAP